MRSFVICGVLLCLGAFITKSDLAWPNWTLSALAAKWAGTEGTAVILILACVASESIQEVLRDFMGDEIRGRQLTIAHLIRVGDPPLDQNKMDRKVFTSVFAIQSAICVAISAVGLFFVSSEDWKIFHGATPNIDPFTVLAYSMLLLLLGMVGHVYKNVVIDPLRSNRFLSPHTIPIYQAVRPVILYFLSWGTIAALLAMQGRWIVCRDIACQFYFWGSHYVSLTTSIVPKLNESYYLGCAILSSVFAYYLIRFHKEGYAIQTDSKI
jgi:hypothetical protein